MLLQEIKEIQITEKVLKHFGLLLAIFISVLGGISLWRHGSAYFYWFPCALVVFLVTLFYPNSLKFIYIPWMAMAKVIGWTMTRVILTFIYYCAFTPFSVLAKIMGKDLLDEKIEPAKKSYWVIRNKKVILREELEHQF